MERVLAENVKIGKMVSPFVRQLWIVSGVFLNMIAQGVVLSYSSCLLPALRDPDSSIRASMLTSSWITSSIGIGSLPGFFLSSYLMDLWGRRLAHAVVVVPGLLGWLLIYFASDVTTLFIARLCCGFTTGATVSLGAVVIGEYSSPANRGMFLNLKTASVCLGSMAVHIFGNYFSWRIVALIALIPNTMALFMIYTWPESPSWLAAKKKFKKCKKAFFWLRGKDEMSLRELTEMLKAQITSNDGKSRDLTLTQKIKEFFQKFKQRDFLLPVFTIFLGSIMLEVSGRHIFPAYALDIIGEITGDKSQSFFYILAIDIIVTASALFSSVLVRIMKRRVVLFSTGVASLVVLFSVCIYLYLASIEFISKDHIWIPMTMLVVFFIFINLGCTPIPLAFLGELLPLAHRGTGSAMAGLFMALTLNAALQMTPYLLFSIKVHGTFTVLGVSLALVLAILYFILPETKDRTLQEIEYYFNNGKFRDLVIKDDCDATTTKMLDDHDIMV